MTPPVPAIDFASLTLESFRDRPVAVLGLACVSNSPGHATEMLDEAVRFIEEEILGLAEVVDCQTEVLPGLE